MYIETVKDLWSHFNSYPNLLSVAGDRNEDVYSNEAIEELLEEIEDYKVVSWSIEQRDDGFALYIDVEESEDNYFI